MYTGYVHMVHGVRPTPRNSSSRCVFDFQIPRKHFQISRRQTRASRLFPFVRLTALPQIGDITERDGILKIRTVFFRTSLHNASGSLSNTVSKLNLKYRLKYSTIVLLRFSKRVPPSNVEFSSVKAHSFPRTHHTFLWCEWQNACTEIQYWLSAVHDFLTGKRGRVLISYNP